MELIQFFIDSPVFTSLSKTLLHFLWQGLLIAAVLFVVLQVLDKKQSELRYVSALFALSMCVATPIVTFFWFYQPTVVLSMQSLPDVYGVAMNSASQLIEGPGSWWQLALPLTAVLWLLGVIYLSVHLVFELISVYQLPRKQVIRPEQGLNQLFARLVSKLDANPMTQLMVSMKAEVPMVVGWIKPVVLLPLSMASGLTHDQLEMLLAHELAHVKRHDYLINFFQTLAEILLFFHPAVKWISRQIRIEREFCCDDIAVNVCGNVKAYATALTDAEQIRRKHIPQLAMAATGGALKERVVRMIEQTDCANKYSRSGYSMVLAAIFCVSLSVSLFSAHAGYKTRVAEMLEQYAENQNQGDETLKLEVFPALAGSVSNPALRIPIVNTSQVFLPQNTHLTDSNQALVVNLSVPATESGGVKEQAREVGQKLASELSTASTQVTAEQNSDRIVNTSDDNSKLLVQLPVENEDSEVSDLPLDSTVDLIAPTQPDSIVLDIPEVATPQAPDLAVKPNLELEQNDNGSELSSELDSIDLIATSPPVSSAQSQGAESVALATIVAPNLVRTARPDYPRSAISRNAEADVYVTFVVNENGRVTDIEFDNDVAGFFKRSVRKALNLWRFEPGKVDGRVTQMSISRVFTFSDPNTETEQDAKLMVTGSRIAKDI